MAWTASSYPQSPTLVGKQVHKTENHMSGETNTTSNTLIMSAGGAELLKERTQLTQRHQILGTANVVFMILKQRKRNLTATKRSKDASKFQNWH